MGFNWRLHRIDDCKAFKSGLGCRLQTILPRRIIAGVSRPPSHRETWGSIGAYIASMTAKLSSLDLGADCKPSSREESSREFRALHRTVKHGVQLALTSHR